MLPLVRWYRNAIRNALTVEEIVERTRHSLWCVCDIWDETGHRREKNEYIGNTTDFLLWSKEVEDLKKTLSEKGRLYPVVGFYSDNPVKTGREPSSPTGRVIAKSGSYYFVEKTDRSISYSPRIEDAKVFDSLDEAKAVVGTAYYKTPWAFIDADKALARNAKKTWILEFRRPWTVHYATRHVRGSWKLTPFAENAKRYTEADAKRIAAKICLADETVKVAAIPYPEVR